MGAAASAAISGSHGAHRLFDGMPPVERGGDDTRAAAAAAGGEEIGALPDGVLAHILGLLPAEEALRTCVLARRWRHLWKSATGLRVVAADGEFFGTVGKLQELVDRLLPLRGRAPLDACYLSVHDGRWHNKTARRCLSTWFRFLRLCIEYCGVPCGGGPEHPFEDLPLVSRHLKRLELEGVQLGSSFVNFSSCLALEHLVSDWCALSTPAKMISSESLKYLSMTNLDLDPNSRLHIYAPNLVSLRLDKFFGRTPVLEIMPSLVEAFVNIT